MNKIRSFFQSGDGENRLQNELFDNVLVKFFVDREYSLKIRIID